MACGCMAVFDRRNAFRLLSQEPVLRMPCRAAQLRARACSEHRSPFASLRFGKAMTATSSLPQSGPGRSRGCRDSRVDRPPDPRGVVWARNSTPTGETVLAARILTPSRPDRRQHRHVGRACPQPQTSRSTRSTPARLSVTLRPPRPATERYRQWSTRQCGSYLRCSTRVPRVARKPRVGNTALPRLLRRRSSLREQRARAADC